ncbi:MAG TPA: hypothetical protein EYP14_16545, partial [Planctomycetaceae bacterium]|nr:hypothetical protein [Planctomycetaceae bacterium]
MVAKSFHAGVISLIAVGILLCPLACLEEAAGEMAAEPDGPLAAAQQPQAPAWPHGHHQCVCEAFSGPARSPKTDLDQGRLVGTVPPMVQQWWTVAFPTLGSLPTTQAFSAVGARSG